jgi:hypothetical protein
MTEIDIKGINKTDLLKELWNNSKIAGFFNNYPFPPPGYDIIKAKEAVTKYIDYFQGRVIKSDISQDVANTCGYDRDMGEGSFKKCVDKLRNNS